MNEFSDFFRNFFGIFRTHCCFTENEYLQSLNPEGDLEELVYEIFEPFDLKDIPE